MSRSSYPSRTPRCLSRAEKWEVHAPQWHDSGICVGCAKDAISTSDAVLSELARYIVDLAVLSAGLTHDEAAHLQRFVTAARRPLAETLAALRTSLAEGEG